MFLERSTLALDITYMTCREVACPTDEFLSFGTFIPGAPNDFFL